MKRFYRNTTAVAGDKGYEIHLDGKPVKTPGGALLTVSSPKMADLMAAEWAAQDKNIIPDSMPVTQIFMTMIDRVTPGRKAIETAVGAYLDTDLLCYRASDPPPVVTAQARWRDPWLSWFRDKFGINLAVTTGLSALRQPTSAHDAVKIYIRGLDDLRLTILQIVVAASGSLVLGLAFINSALTVDELMVAVYAEEDIKADIYREDFYGRAPQEEKRRAAIIRDMTAARMVLEIIAYA